MISKMQQHEPKQIALKPSKELKVSQVMSTYFPDPCSVCNLHQCETDARHTFHYTIAKTIDKSITEAFAKCNKKPPDIN